MKPPFGVSLALLIIAPALASARPPAPAEAAQRLEKACDAKDMKACFDVARMHWRGDVTGWIDWKKAWPSFQSGVAVV